LLLHKEEDRKKLEIYCLAFFKYSSSRKYPLG
jgi:hypothetical protein